MYSSTSLLLMAGNPDSGGSPLPTFIFMGAAFFIIYFFMIRPQSKKASDQKKFIDNLKKGDKVVTIGGIHGKVTSLDAESLMLEIDANVKIKLQKSGISMDFTKAAYPNQDSSSNSGKTKESTKELSSNN